MIERDKERLRIKAEVNVVRNLRFRDARYRTIGIDEQALREQVQEKQRWKNQERDEGILDSNIKYLIRRFCAYK